MRAVVTDRAQQSQLAPPFQHVPEQHRAKTERSQHKPQTAQHLERRDKSIFDAMESCEPLVGLYDVETEIRQSLFQLGRNLARSIRLRDVK